MLEFCREMRAHLCLVRLWVCVVLISLVTALSANAEDSPLAAPGAYLQNIPAKESEAGKFDERKLQALVMAMADDYVAIVSEVVYLDLLPSAQTSYERVLAQSLMRNSFGAAAEIAAGPNPDIALLDLLVLVSLQRKTFERHWMPNVWGSSRSEKPLIRLISIEHELWRRSGSILSKDQKSVLRRLIDTWLENNPDRIVVELTRFDEFANARHIPNLTDREEASGLLSDVADAVSAIDDALLFGERSLWYAGRMSYILGEQAELTAYRILATPELQSLLDKAQGMEASIAKLSATAGDMPSFISQERRKLLSEVRAERKAAIENMNSVFRTSLNDALAGLVGAVKNERQQVIDHFFKNLALERREVFNSINDGSDKIGAVLPQAQALVTASTELARVTNETASTIERLTGRFAAPAEPSNGQRDTKTFKEALELAGASKALLVQVQTLLELPQLNSQVAAANAFSTNFVDRIFLWIGAIIVLIFAGVFIIKKILTRAALTGFHRTWPATTLRSR